MIKIALCTDTYYMMACGPCVVSIFEHHREQPCHILRDNEIVAASRCRGFGTDCRQVWRTSDGQDYSSGDSARPESER